MASIYSFEIDGWGVVGPRVTVTASEGFADGSFTLTGSEITSSEIGAMCWVENADVVPDGLYTYTVKGSGIMTFQAAIADVTVGTFTPAGAFVRIEDHYRISDGVPDWVTGDLSAARWYTDIVGVTSSAGQRIPATGGLASVDGVEVIAARREGLAAIRPETYRVSTVGPVTAAAPLAASATEVITYAAAPFSGESATTPTGTAEPPWFDLEAIDVRGVPTTSTVDGVTTYTVTHNGTTTFVTRGVLRTAARSHPQGAAIFGRIPTPVGQTCRTFVYPEGHTSHASRVEKMQGVCEGTNPSEGSATRQRFSLASQLLAPYRRSLGTAKEVWTPPENPSNYESGGLVTTVKSHSGSAWSWILVDGIAAVKCARTGSAPIAVDENGAETWKYLIYTPVEYAEDFPIVRRTDDVEQWDRVAVARIARIVSTGEFPIFVLIGGTTDRYVAATPSGSPMCHVFEPITWARTSNGDSWVTGAADRLIKVNPVDVILTVLTSTGTPASNGAHDRAPFEFGLGIPVSDIDSATFTTIGNRLDTQGISAGSVSMLTEDATSLSDWIDMFARTYGLAIATTTTGKIRLIDLTELDFDTTVSLQESDLVSVAKLTIAAQMAIESVTVSYDQPWISPDEPESQISNLVRAEPGGILSLFEKLKGETIEIAPPFAAAVDDSSRDALFGRWATFMGYSNGTIGSMTADVDPGYVGEIGDTVSVTLPAFPNAPDTGAMTGALCRIMDRVHEARPIGANPRDTLTLHVYGVTDADATRAWAPTGKVSAVTSATVFTVEASAYHGADYSTDASTFADGADVDIWSTNWGLRSTTTPGTVSGTSGNVITLSIAAQDGGGDVTPIVGDKVTLSAESDQSTTEAAKWGWLSATTPGIQWH